MEERRKSCTTGEVNCVRGKEDGIRRNPSRRRGKFLRDKMIVEEKKMKLECEKQNHICVGKTRLDRLNLT